MGDPIGTNVDVFWEISANFLEIQPKLCQFERQK